MIDHEPFLAVRSGMAPSLYQMLDLFRLLLDFGIVVLTWVIQLVVYPSFKYLSRNGLREWHQKYTLQISFIVVPLMLGQLAIAFFQVFFFMDAYTISSAVLIAVAWFLTFYFAAPTHHMISLQEDHLPLINRLIYINWFRTLAWNLAFIISFLRFLNLSV